MDRTRKILVVVVEVAGIEEGDKTIVMTVTVVMVVEITIVEGVVELTTMTAVDHPSVVTMVLL